MPVSTSMSDKSLHLAAKFLQFVVFILFLTHCAACVWNSLRTAPSDTSFKWQLPLDEDLRYEVVDKHLLGEYYMYIASFIGQKDATVESQRRKVFIHMLYEYVSER